MSRHRGGCAPLWGASPQPLPWAAANGSCGRRAWRRAPPYAQPANNATAFPTKPIRVIVTFPPGGSADAVVRMLVPKLNDKLGQAVIVDNRPGAGGNVGLTAVAKAPGDGYTLGVGAAG